MFKNFRMGKKLGIGFGAVLGLLIVLAGYCYLSLADINEQIQASQDACTNRAFAIEKEVDHLKWMADLSALFLDHNATGVTVQTDPHKCGLGQWMYSEETQRRRRDDPELAAILDRIEAPHNRLHESAKRIDDTYVAFDRELEAQLTHGWTDHLAWIKELANSNLSRRVFEGQRDPRLCNFGKWYHSYQSDNPELRTLMAAWEEPHRRLHESATAIVEAQRAGNWQDATRLYHERTMPALDDLNACFDKTQAWVGDISHHQREAIAVFDTVTSAAVAETQAHLLALRNHFIKQSDEAIAETDAIMSCSTNVMILLTLIALAIGLTAAIVITRVITRPITSVVGITEAMNREFSEVAVAVEAIARNDLTVDIPEASSQRIDIVCNDEIGVLCQSVRETLASKNRMTGAVRQMTNNLIGVVRQLGDNASQLVSAATEVASASEQMSRGANDQTNQIAQVSTAIEEMTATIVESSKNAGEASNGARSASDTAGEGGAVVQQTVQGMQRITDVVRQSASSIGKLAHSADQIGEIINVIDDIADQTNLLALNAAIEAARAGEQGRGFAVVADEVRKLAERTGKATGEITEMIKGIQSETQEAVKSMDAGIAEVDQGRDLADRAGNSLSEIVAMSQRVMDMIQQIATATEEQSAAAEQISKNVENVSSIARESATGAEQSAAAAEQLNRQAESLQQIVAQFKVRT
jgi:methyl-accepting chemotaxis protein